MKDLPLHDCTEEDWEQFYQSDSSAGVYLKGKDISQLKSDFKCLDWD